MLLITDINIDDLKLFLNKNNIIIPNTEEKIFNLAKDIIINEEVNYYPDVIIDWIVAYNFLLDGKYIKMYSRDDIYNMSDDEIFVLANKLGSDDPIDRTSIINILFYLRKLKEKRTYLNFTGIPEIDTKIIANINLITLLDNLSIDGTIRPLIYRAIPELVTNNIYKDDLYDFLKLLEKMKEWKLLIRLIKELYKQDNGLYEDAIVLYGNNDKNYPSPPEDWTVFLEYDTLISLLKYDPSIKDLIYDSIPAIVNLFRANLFTRKFTGQKIEEKDDLSYLILRLKQLGEFDLMDKFIDEFKLDQLNF